MAAVFKPVLWGLSEAMDIAGSADVRGLGAKLAAHIAVYGLRNGNPRASESMNYRPHDVVSNKVYDGLLCINGSSMSTAWYIEEAKKMGVLLTLVEGTSNWARRFEVSKYEDAGQPPVVAVAPPPVAAAVQPPPPITQSMIPSVIATCCMSCCPWWRASHNRLVEDRAIQVQTPAPTVPNPTPVTVPSPQESKTTVPLPVTAKHVKPMSSFNTPRTPPRPPSATPLAAEPVPIAMPEPVVNDYSTASDDDW